VLKFARCTLAVVLLAAVPFVACAASLDLVREGQPAQLVELYTSQGCSSCPPADRWLNAFSERAELWTSVVPVAFHVDYWNYLGWPDNFSDRRYSTRQRAYRRAGAIASVYTPGFVVDGREWRGYFSRLSLPNAEPLDTGKLRLTSRDGQMLLLWQPKHWHSDHADYVGNLAIMGFDFEVKIDRGENRGRRLHYDFAVLHFDKTRLKFEQAQGHWRAALPLPATLPTALRYGIAGWVIPAGGVKPIQVLGGWADINSLTAGL